VGLHLIRFPHSSAISGAFQGWGFCGFKGQNFPDFRLVLDWTYLHSRYFLLFPKKTPISFFWHDLRYPPSVFWFCSHFISTNKFHLEIQSCPVCSIKIILDGRSVKCFLIFLHLFSPPIFPSIRIATTLKENSNPSWFSSCLLKFHVSVQPSLSPRRHSRPSSLELLIWMVCCLLHQHESRKSPTRVATARLLPSPLHFSFFSSLHLPRISYPR